MRTLRIVTGDQEKGRTFSAAVLAMVEAAIWEGSSSGGKARRPALLSLACTHGVAGPMLANLRMGKRASYRGDGSKDETVELLKSAKYVFTSQRCEAGIRIDAYLSTLFDLDPGFVDGDKVAFVCLPDRAWLMAQDIDVGAAVAHMRRIKRIVENERVDGPTEADVIALAYYAPIFAKYLLGRCRLPLIPDIGFLTQVLCAALSERLARRAWAGYGHRGWGRVGASYETTYREDGVEDAGFAPGISFMSDRDTLETLLSNETMFYVRPTRR